MATITGTLSDFGLEPLSDRAPIIRFIPSAAGVNGARLFASTPITVTPAPDGSFAVELASTDGVVPDAWYTVQIEHLNSGGVPTHFDVLGLRIYVPLDYDGPMSELPGVPLSPDTVLVSLDLPPQGFKGYWLYSPADGQEMPLDDPAIGMLRRVY